MVDVIFTGIPLAKTCHVAKPKVHEAGNSSLPTGNMGKSYKNGWGGDNLLTGETDGD